MNPMQNPDTMQIMMEPIDTACAEIEVLDDLLDMDGKVLLELGCGGAEMTRTIATAGRDRRVIATEVDRIQLERNQQITDLPNVEFIYAGIEQLPVEDRSIDIALLFKSLHHVPVDLMAQGFSELHRVLRPGGLVYVSEPVFAGNFNEILKLFHDEQAVRAAAFEAIRTAVEAGGFDLVTERFFNTTVRFENFDDFASRVIDATHSDHQLSDAQYTAVRRTFEETTAACDGDLTMPIRVDLLRKI